jgi:hypothetical protein
MSDSASERMNWLRLADALAAEHTGIQLVARRPAAEACFIDIEACTLGETRITTARIKSNFGATPHTHQDR